jgi:hypothetical protein
LGAQKFPRKLDVLRYQNHYAKGTRTANQYLLAGAFVKLQT